MGTDITAFVEKRFCDESSGFSGRPEEPPWILGRFWMGRDYDLFDALANGRSDRLDPEEVDRHALIPPRGIPRDLSYEVALEYYDLIIDPAGIDPRVPVGYQTISKSEAKQRVEAGLAHYGKVAAFWPYSEKKPLWNVVSKPYLHNVGWLTLEEINQALDHFKMPLDDVDIEFLALMHAMEVFDQESSPMEVRLTFWFES
ncbi:hypothetical protein Pan241w_22700 [Gimesia alba]|uniref:Uncharacterized protein n=1 Tax=Gimesia alba TaxID=2527973 RepID=A0A517RE92_9PLAN|nr:hypothetical protein [Gimesia alba]QDT42189.1 hypothetical protein Pan241w_22700 [Gimesia alba]